MFTTRSTSPPAPAIEPAAGADGTVLILCAHGTRGLAGAVGDHAAALRADGRLGAVRACALYGAPTLEDTLDSLAGRSARLVPFMMAEGYTLAALRRRVAAHPGGGRVEIARAVGADPGLTPLIADKARASCRAAGWREEDTALLLVGHGTTRHSASAETAEAHAARLRALGGFAEVATAYLDDEPAVPTAVAACAAPRCVAVGFFTDAGDHGRDDVPVLLARCARPTRYAGPIGPDARVREAILAQATATDPRRAPAVVAAPAKASGDAA